MFELQFRTTIHTRQGYSDDDVTVIHDVWLPFMLGGRVGGATQYHLVRAFYAVLTRGEM